jgi:hypothetical protein
LLLGIEGIAKLSMKMFANYMRAADLTGDVIMPWDNHAESPEMAVVYLNSLRSVLILTFIATKLRVLSSVQGPHWPCYIPFEGIILWNSGPLAVVHAVQNGYSVKIIVDQDMSVSFLIWIRCLIIFIVPHRQSYPILRSTWLFKDEVKVL